MALERVTVDFGPLHHHIDLWPSVYAYIPTPNNLCSDNGITCNSDFGTSISRGSFGFESGRCVNPPTYGNSTKIFRRWNRITMLIQVNNPPNIANGNLLLLSAHNQRP